MLNFKQIIFEEGNEDVIEIVSSATAMGLLKISGNKILNVVYRYHLK